MKDSNHWKLLRSGNATLIKRGLQQLEKAHAQMPDPSHIMELGVAYLWVQQYEAAWNHFRHAIAQDSAGTSSFYVMAGTSRWCIGEFDEAVRQWSSGLDADFQDVAGLGIELPLLLFFASLRRPMLFKRSSAENILRKKTSDSRIKLWPGPVVKWLLGQLSEHEFLSQQIGADEAETVDRRWFAHFYEFVLQYGKEGFIFKNSMQKLVNTSDPQWADETFFLARMWGGEFFLARFESEL